MFNEISSRWKERALTYTLNRGIDVTFIMT